MGGDFPEGGRPAFLWGGTEPNRKHHGVLLIHGFTGSIAHMRPIAQELHARGFTVMGINLPGHATDLDDMVRYTWEDWLNAAKRRAEVVELTDELAACIPNPEDERQRESRELGEALNRFLERLPQESRLIFMRRYWYMDSVHEIAARYGFGESRVKTSLFRTRQKLREYLEKEEVSV